MIIRGCTSDIPGCWKTGCPACRQEKRRTLKRWPRNGLQ
nr:MAG TPA: ArsC family reductase [Caudoviricetes sp.]